ncbi:hypothetical protein [Nocardia sp. NPDC057668]|uniref:hypothetical protein n=1 Tax=Nocardia sp. NPDC057668 TaxID=3346202 RepID=UPI00366D30DE
MVFNARDHIAVDTLAGRDAQDGIAIRSDLLPPTTHDSNIRGIVDREIWDALRIPVCAAAGNRCEICGERSTRNGRSSRPDCHEKWVFEFRDDRPVQRLQRLIAVCQGCRQVQHSGLARVKGLEHEVIARLCRINRWSREQADADLDRSSARCSYLDQFDWDLDLSVLRGQIVLRDYPDMYVPAQD